MSGQGDKGKGTRRGFVLQAALLGAATAPRGGVAAQTGFGNQMSSIGTVPRRRLGKSDVEVSIIGVGGYHIGSAETLSEAKQIVNHALDSGINFFDNAWEYHDGQSEEWLGAALGNRRKEAILMTKVCTHGRDKKVALSMLEESLRRLKTDHLDVWQVHEVIYDNDPDKIFAPNGAAEALLQAKKEGKVRLIGFTGHKDPSIHLKMLSHGFPFDTVQMPLNPFDASFRSFEQHVLPEANRQGLAVLGMKSLGGSGEMVTKGAITVAESLRYAMSLPVTVTISGMNSMDVLKQNLEIVRSFHPMSAEEMISLRMRCKVEASDGRLELFKTSTKYDGPIGREQHGFPGVDELPA
jgi:aryl-alcohol dehydrogenase-like predicted oxidoreductase